MDEGLLSEAAARLCSRGLAEPIEGLLSIVQSLFPSAVPITATAPVWHRSGAAAEDRRVHPATSRQRMSPSNCGKDRRALRRLGSSVSTAPSSGRRWVGGAGPWIQAAVQTMRRWTDDLHGDEVIVKIDLANAYNSINRVSCLSELRDRCPELLPWAKWCLSGPSDVFFGHIIECQTGVQQGDSLAPPLFSMGLQALSRHSTDPLASSNCGISMMVGSGAE